MHDVVHAVWVLLRHRPQPEQQSSHMSPLAALQGEPRDTSFKQMLRDVLQEEFHKANRRDELCDGDEANLTELLATAAYQSQPIAQSDEYGLRWKPLAAAHKHRALEGTVVCE